MQVERFNHRNIRKLSDVEPGTVVRMWNFNEGADFHMVSIRDSVKTLTNLENGKVVYAPDTQGVICYLDAVLRPNNPEYKAHYEITETVA